jgi:hypothetical protein
MVAIIRLIIKISLFQKKQSCMHILSLIKNAYFFDFFLLKQGKNTVSLGQCYNKKTAFSLLDILLPITNCVPFLIIKWQLRDCNPADRLSRGGRALQKYRFDKLYPHRLLQ